MFYLLILNQPLRHDFANPEFHVELVVTPSGSTDIRSFPSALASSTRDPGVAVKKSVTSHQDDSVTHFAH